MGQDSYPLNMSWGLAAPEVRVRISKEVSGKITAVRARVVKHTIRKSEAFDYWQQCGYGEKARALLHLLCYDSASTLRYHTVDFTQDVRCEDRGSVIELFNHGN